MQDSFNIYVQEDILNAPNMKRIKTRLYLSLHVQ